MLEWLWTNAGEMKDLIGLAAIALPVAYWLVRKAMFSTKQLQKVLEGYSDLAAGLGEIRSQLRPNGGTSMFDMLAENTRATNMNAESIKAMGDKLAEVRAYQFQAAEILASSPVWYADPSGACTRVNLEYAALAERSPAELIGSGWENFVSPADRSRVSAEWHDAVKKKRAFEAEFVVQTRTGKRMKVRAASTPITKDTGEVVGYVGRFHAIEPTP